MYFDTLRTNVESKSTMQISFFLGGAKSMFRESMYSLQCKESFQTRNISQNRIKFPLPPNSSPG